MQTVFGSIPVVYDVDVAVAGGGMTGAAAALAAARRGASVFLGVAENACGEDVWATGMLWQKPEETDALGLLAKVFPGDAPYVRPMDVKRALDDLLLEAGVRFRYLSSPSDLLVDGNGAVAGVVFAGKSGSFAVRAKAVVDATRGAVLARSAGLPFTAWKGGELEMRAVVLGARAPEPEALDETPLGLVSPPENEPGEPVPAYLYTFKAPLADASEDAFQRAESEIFARIWHKDQTWRSDRCLCLPPERIDREAARDAVPAGFFFEGAAATDDAETAERLLWADYAAKLGASTGAAAALWALEGASAPAGKVRPAHAAAGKPTKTGFAGEPCTDPRARREALGEIAGLVDVRGLPVLDTVDVLVVGGGTGGAPAAVAAAREGARTLCLESLYVLGGTATAGFISRYYHGYRQGATEEIACWVDETAEWKREHHQGFINPAWKAEALRRKLLAAGGRVWFGATVSGVVTKGNRVEAVVVNTPRGRGLVKTRMLVDATGNSDIAAFAGMPVHEVFEDGFVFQGSGMPSRPFRPDYRNTDYTFILDSDIADQTRAFVVGRRKCAAAFDFAQMVDTRERRQIAGDIVLSARDAYGQSTWADAVCRAYSNFDTHGMTNDPMFVVLSPDRVELNVWLPMRALTPAGWDGIAVTGLGVSAHRDLMPVLRMQPDIQNQAWSVGVAAAWAARAKNPADRDFRKTDFRALQRKMAAFRANIPPSAVLYADSRFEFQSEPPTDAALGPLALHEEITIFLTGEDFGSPEEKKLTEMLEDVRTTLGKLAPREDEGPDPLDTPEIRWAKLLALRGSRAGEGALLDALRRAEDWDGGWNYRGMGQFCRSMSPLDDILVALGWTGTKGAVPEAVRLLRKTGPETELSHIRAAARFASCFAGAPKERKALVGALSDVAKIPGMTGHSWATLADELRDIPESTVDTTTRTVSLRELFLAAGLYRLGDDAEKTGERILRAYARDIRGQYAASASMELSRAGR